MTKNGKFLLPAVFIASCFTPQILEGIKHKEMKEKPVIGCDVILRPNALIYENPQNAVNKQDPMIPSYSYEEERLIVSAIYELNGEYKIVSMTDGYFKQEKQIINDGGTRVAILTQNENNNVIEGFYNVEDIFGYDYSKAESYSKQKTLGN